MGFHLANLRKLMLSAVSDLFNHCDITLNPSAVEIGGRYNPLSIAVSEECSHIYERLSLCDPVYGKKKPELEGRNKANTQILSMGIPQNTRGILRYINNNPFDLYLESVLNYFSLGAISPLLRNANQVFVVNNHLAGVGAPYSSRSISFPEEIQGVMDRVGLTPRFVNHRNGLLDFNFVGIFGR